MGRHDLKRGRLAAAICAATLIISGGATFTLAGAGTAAAAPPVPWATATTITGTGSDASVKELVIAADGSAVALWNQSAGSFGRKLYAAVRPADSDTWGSPYLLTTTPTEAGRIKLIASADGTVTAAWIEFPNETAPESGGLESRLVTAVLSADRSSWSDPIALVTADQSLNVSGIDLAEGPDGSVTAAWSARPTSTTKWEVSTATRGAAGNWSAPVQVSAAAADGAMAGSPEAAVSTDGTIVIAYDQWDSRLGLSTVRTVSRPASAAEWSAPVQATEPRQGMGGPQIAAANDGSMTLVWAGKKEESELHTIYAATRADASAPWGAAEPVSTTESLVETPDPLVAPNGEVTLVWVDRTTTFSTRTATRGAAGGSWSAAKTLSTGYVPEQYDASIGADGTVRAIWTQTDADDNGRVLMESTLTGGAWDTAEELPGSATKFVYGRVAAGTGGTATAVWSGTNQSDITQLYGSRTTWPATLSVTGSTVPVGIQLKNTTSTSTAWAPTWKLNRPTSTWSVTLTDTADRTVRTLTGATDDLTVAPAWNGRTSSGAYAANGRLKWTLRATATGASGATTLSSGYVNVAGGAAVRRDVSGPSAAPDGIGDLVTLSSAGVLAFRNGTGTGTFSGETSGSGWSTSAVAVPFGDLNGDRCNDVLVRLGGELRAYKPGCGKAVTPTTAYTSLGTTWAQFNVLTSPGDMTGDGRPDLVARQASTGDMYLYADDGAGKLKARGRIGTNWKLYRAVSGAGDLNGDGIGDLMAVDGTNQLWRYEGTATGTVKPRALVFGNNWATGRNVFVGVGDITGDGKADLISRNAAGDLLRNPGNGAGFFGSTVKIGTGWQGYKGLF
ncbi:VCBS repeat-containing protein [Streptomyces sp. NPDC005283]|uniref:FG-GAP repeat domain-containing protein n=1 Tax=Streptomyces sp. NPDC005283 TaxID=3156871 RepID=UPI0034548231